MTITIAMTIAGWSYWLLANKECPYCDKSHTSFQVARRHIYNAHEKTVTVRVSGGHGSSVHVNNEKNVQKYTQTGYLIFYKMACVSCTRVFNNKQDFASHVDSTHILEPLKADELVTGNHWIKGDKDVSPKFYLYRKSCIESSNSTIFNVDTHFNELLSLSTNIVLEQRYNYQRLPANIFHPDLLKLMRKQEIGSCTQRWRY